MKNKSFLEITKKLGPLEEKILFLVEGSKSPREILNQLNQGEKQYAYTTIMTVMDKLYKKGYLTRVKKEKTYFYQPVDNLAKLIEANHLSIFEYLIKFFGRANFFKKSLYLIFILPFLNNLSITVITVVYAYFLSTSFNLFKISRGHFVPSTKNKTFSSSGPNFLVISKKLLLFISTIIDSRLFLWICQHHFLALS